MSLSLSCNTTNVPVVGSQTSTRIQVINTTAVDHVYQNGTFTVAVTPQPGNESSDLGSGATLRYIRDLEYRVGVPANSQLLVLLDLRWLRPRERHAEQSSLSGSTLVDHVPGQIQPNTNYQLPTLNMTLRATGSALSTIQTELGGNELREPRARHGRERRPAVAASATRTSRPPASRPVDRALSTTTIWPLDTAAPAITITSPPDGATYAQGSPSTPSYSCNDGPFGVGVATCTGPVPNGAAIDTSTLGVHRSP